MLKYLPLIFLLSFLQTRGQTNIVPNSGFELFTNCPNSSGQWNFCSSWDNVNLITGQGLWGTPDYYNTCGSGGTAPPNTFGGVCPTQAGNCMMSLVMYNVPYPGYREYLAAPLNCPMQPGNTYTLSFWLSNGTVVYSPWTIKNIGAHFSNGPLSQSGYNVINVIPQCEITTYVVSPGWTQFTFTVNPTATWDHITVGSFRSDAINSPVMAFPNPGGPASSYANYFLDNVELFAPVALSPTIIASGPTVVCIGSPATLTASGATNYTWQPGNLSGSTITVSPGSSTNYTVFGANSSCFIGFTTLSVTVIPTPTIISLASPSSVCVGGNSNLLSGGALTYTWQPGNLNTALITVTPAISTIYTVSGTNLAGCISTSTVLVNVVPIPTITIDPPSATACLGSTLTLFATGATNYTWNPGGNTTAALTITPAVSTIYTVTGTNGTCSSTETVLVNVTPSPTVIAVTSNTLVCSGNSATLSASGATTYTWNPGNLSGTSVTVSPGSTTVYTVMGTTGLCSDTKTVLVIVNDGPSLTITSSPTTVCSGSGSSSTLTANGALSYTWATGPVISSSLVITPSVTTTYSVAATNSLGCVSTTQFPFFVTPTPTLTASSSPTVICIGKNATLTASGATNYTWSPGNMTTASATVSPPTSQVYTVTGINNGCISSSTLSLIANPNPTLTVSSSPTAICQGNSSTLTATGAISYTWNPGALTGQTVNVTPLSTTNFTVTGANAFGCAVTAITSVSVNVTTTINIVASPTAICIGNTATLTASGATNYTWNPGSIPGTSISVNPVSTTNYTVIGETANCLGSKTISLIVNPLPIINVSSNTTAICIGNSATLTATSGSTYTWNPGALTGSNVVVSPLINTVYTVAATNTNGCSNTKTISLIVNSLPTITAVASLSNICSNSGTSSTLTATGAVSYTWTPGNLVGASFFVSPGATTNYTVTGTNLSGCRNTQTVSVFVTPTPTITAIASSFNICSGSNTTLTALGGATSYTWLPGGSTTTNIVVSPTTTSVYTISGSNGNCNSSIVFTVTVRPTPTITVSTLPYLICNGGAVLNTAAGASSYSWNTGATTSTLLVTPTISTSYTVTGTNLAGCSNSAVTNVSVNPSPTISVIPSASLICSGSTATLTISGALNYVCNPGAITSSVIVVSPLIQTTYTIIGINSFGCTDTKTITISTTPGPTINVTSSDTLLCSGSTFSLNAFGATNYTWLPVNLNSSTIAITATTSISIYTVIGESGGCNSSKTISVTVINCNNSIFGVTKAAGKPVLVYNTFYNVTFTITAVNASTLSLTNVVLNEDLNVAFPLPVNYTVVNQPLITSQNSGLNINPLFDGSSQISLTAPGTSTLFPNKRDTIVFTVRLDPKGFYGPFKNWVIGFANALNNFTVIDSSNNGFNWDPDHDGDPTNNDTVTVIDLTPIDLFIPDGFSPNGDGKNDVFFIKGLNARPVRLSIFNRWGNKVYEKNEYDNSWDGTVNAGGMVIGGDKVPSATYYYVIEFLDGDKEVKTGFVVVQY